MLKSGRLGRWNGNIVLSIALVFGVVAITLVAAAPWGGFGLIVAKAAGAASKIIRPGEPIINSAVLSSATSSVPVKGLGEFWKPDTSTKPAGVVNESPETLITVLPGNNSTSANGRAPQGSRLFINTKYILMADELTASGFSGPVTSVGWRWNVPSPPAAAAPVAQSVATTGNLKVYLLDTDPSVTELFDPTVDPAGYTKIIDGTITIPATVNEFNIDIPAGGPGTSTFSFTPGRALTLLFQYETTTAIATPSGAPTVLCIAFTAGTNHTATYQSNTANGNAGTFSAFRPETRFGNNVGGASPSPTPPPVTPTPPPVTPTPPPVTPTPPPVTPTPPPVTPTPTPPSGRTAFDFDGDHKADVSVFRPSVGQWFLNRSTAGFLGVSFGSSTDIPRAADYTGDGKTDIAFFRPSDNNWYILRSEDFTFYAFPFGASGDIPSPADFDGDGKADAAVYRPSVQTWFILKSTGGVSSINFGLTNDVPVPADYTGDGKADVAIYRPSLGQWWYLNSANSNVFAATFGSSTDKPTPGDFTGDGKADVAFYRPSEGSWYILRSENFTYYAFPFGNATDKPAPADFDGDGKYDAAVFRPSDTNWYILKSTGGVSIVPFGLSNDIPVPGQSVPSGSVVSPTPSPTPPPVTPTPPPVTPTPTVQPPTPTPTPPVTPTPPPATPTPSPSASPSPACTPIPGTWAAGPNVPPAAMVRSVGVYFPTNGKFYAMGGREADPAGSDFIHPFEYNPVTNTWATMNASYADNEVNNMACGVLTISGTPQIVCVGGSAAGATTSTPRVFSYNPVTDTITALGSDAWPGNSGGTILPGGFAVVNNKLYTVGGFDISGAMIADVWQFDPAVAAGSRWTSRAGLPVQRGYVPTAAIGGFIYTAGGALWNGTTLADSPESFKYEVASNTWTPITNIPRATGETRALNVGGKMYVLGGGRTAPNPSNEVDIYNPATNSWSLGPPFSTARRNFPADTNGTKIFIAGGYSTVLENTMEIFTVGTTCP